MNTHETPDTVTATLDPEPNELASAAEDLVGSVFELGRAWAAHGLGVADRTLQTAARSLEVTARALADLSRRFE